MNAHGADPPARRSTPNGVQVLPRTDRVGGIGRDDHGRFHSLEGGGQCAGLIKVGAADLNSRCGQLARKRRRGIAGTRHETRSPDECSQVRDHVSTEVPIRAGDHQHADISQLAHTSPLPCWLQHERLSRSGLPSRHAHRQLNGFKRLRGRPLRKTVEPRQLRIEVVPLQRVFVVDNAIGRNAVRVIQGSGLHHDHRAGESA